MKNEMVNKNNIRKNCIEMGFNIKLETADELVGKVIGIFSFLAVFVTCLGIFAMSAFVAFQRTREFGIRKILGATPGNLRGVFFNIDSDCLLGPESMAQLLCQSYVLECMAFPFSGFSRDYRDTCDVKSKYYKSRTRKSRHINKTRVIRSRNQTWIIHESRLLKMRGAADEAVVFHRKSVATKQMR